LYILLPNFAIELSVIKEKKCRLAKINNLTKLKTNVMILTSKLNNSLWGGVKFPTGGNAAKADEPASRFAVDSV
jgi:hypothetical protein